MKPQKFSPEYEKIKDLILRDDTHTAEKLIRKYDDCLSQREKEYLTYMVHYHKEVPAQRWKKRVQFVSDHVYSYRSYRQAMSQIKRMGKPSRQYTEVRINIKYAKVAVVEQYLKEYDTVLSEQEKEVLQYLLNRKRTMLHWFQTSPLCRMAGKAVTLSAFLWKPWGITLVLSLPFQYINNPAGRFLLPPNPPIIRTVYTDILVCLHWWVFICMIGTIIVDAWLHQIVYGKDDDDVDILSFLFFFSLSY